MTCRIGVYGKRGQYVYRYLDLPALPPVGGYVCVTDDSIGLKVTTILVSPVCVTLKVQEEAHGDFNFDGLVREGWLQQ